MVEAPLLIRPYLKALNRSELFTVMTCGMSTVAGTVLVLYAGFLQHVIPDALGHILIASLISAPAAVVIAQLMIPPDGAPTDGGLALPETADNAMDARITSYNVCYTKLLRFHHIFHGIKGKS